MDAESLGQKWYALGLFSGPPEPSGFNTRNGTTCMGYTRLDAEYLLPREKVATRMYQVRLYRFLVNGDIVTIPFLSDRTGFNLRLNSQ